MTQGTAPAFAAGSKRRSRRDAARQALPYAATLAVFAALVGAVQALSINGIGGPGTIPRPAEVGSALKDLIPSDVLWVALGETLAPWAVSLGGAAVFGVALGVLVGLSRFASDSTRGLFDLLRSVPPVALIPVAVLILGVTPEFKVALSLQVCIWPIVLQTSAGVQSVHHATVDAAKSINLRRHQALPWLYLPAATPYIGTGVRISAVLALLVCVGCEMLAGVPGLGQLVYTYQATGQIPQMWAMILVVSMVGIAISAIFQQLEKLLTPWANNR